MSAARGLRVAAWAGGVGGALAAAYLGLVTGAVPVDVGVGRRTRPLGPQTVTDAAPRETVFDVMTRPYPGRTPRAMHEKLHVLERGSDLVLAEHYTPIAGGADESEDSGNGPLHPARADRLPAGARPGAARDRVLRP